MTLQQDDQDAIHREVENVSGIESTAVDFEPGVTALTGCNATNRTSLLQAIMAALGSETYTRTFSRQNGRVVTEGNPFVTDPDDVELAEFFAFLLESNEPRCAVALDGDLRELVIRPVDTEAIEAELQCLEAEKRDLDEAHRGTFPDDNYFR